ncbi:MAG: gfo/Idh/MocA family oxidoreductase [Satyrvirus sp.]|uniref:Gfo/Idh/MocA family oxidoreductase n=1 Tax=Satyrvirus sp. TaxID=2487771 RepID=A0A3G5AEK8_9VIRU|nr:MAG: gfo/Idh/MocA family oxidoreductase [Satyrvirus sp.]
MYQIAIFGFGGRCINLLLELYHLVVDTDTKIKVVAIYDNYFDEVLKSISDDKINKIKFFIGEAKIYNEDTQEENVYLENEFDLSFISSQNYKHYNSIILAFKYNKKIFCEKPIVNNLDDLFKIKYAYNPNSYFQTGLTLRYTKMVGIVEKHLHKIGKLKRVYGREFVNIGHGVHIMLGWRRYKNLSGGMGLEKVVHDYDLLIYLIEKVFSISINNIEINGIGKRIFWTKENKQEIIDKISNDTTWYNNYHGWEITKKIHQKIVNDPFEDLDNPNIISDYQKINMKFLDNEIDLEFEVSIGGFRNKTQRYYEFFGSAGNIIVDVIGGVMKINTNTESYEIDLQGDGTGHAGGDKYIMQSFIDMLTDTNKDPNMPSFQEAIRSTHIGLLAELSIDQNKPQIFHV